MPEAAPKEPSQNDMAMGVGRAWLAKRDEHGCPLVWDKKGDPLVVLRNSILPALKAGYTETEVKYALMWADQSIPTPARVEAGLVQVRRGGWRPGPDWAPGEARQRAGSQRFGDRRSQVGPMTGITRHVDDISDEERAAQNPFAGAARSSEVLEQQIGDVA